ncbi:GNAT family N-acetyltransferase [Paenibacillus sp.]|jgi:GNAT superfamily N-acetyltransferase|uniref:GNAT family N-acetyltransferase n=1 Tax=Paenibacillus sp. TaxID=58172 RepID=UPI002825BEA1|nr:GNAT family N-acetyltransferase [Paenibacillus sp.]MDR0266810.1 GNAT family N-acetyltransferase [Paenibacillus sp.]
MRYQVTDEWNEEMWLQAEPIYQEGFPEHGRKNRTIIMRMFERNLCALHVWYDHTKAVAMALTGMDPKMNMLIIDYIAVCGCERGKGLGLACLGDMERWAESRNCRGIVIEAEADPSEENARRIAFWKKAGFTLTDYVHTYIWVPETYRAMYLNLDAENPVRPVEQGKNLFQAILRHHEKAYRGKK